VQEWEATYDACVVIHRPDDFLRLIENALEAQLHPLRSVGVFPITYRKRDYQYDQHDGIDPALIKDPFLASQNEARFVFDPMERPIEAIHLHVRELVECCRILQNEEIPR